MKNKYKPFFYEKRKTPVRNYLLGIIIFFLLSIFVIFQAPGIRRQIGQPLVAMASFTVNSIKDLFAATRMYHEPTPVPQKWTPLELPDKQVLFAENLDNLSAASTADPLADLRQTPEPSEYSKVAKWEYLDPNLNFDINSTNIGNNEEVIVHLIPPVFEHSDIFNDGSAILSAALRFWNITENQYNIADLIHPDFLDPVISFEDLNLYIETKQTEFKTLSRFNGDKGTLIALLQADIPIIVQVQVLSPYRYWIKDDRISSCFLLIHGYDSTQDSFLYQNTTTGNMLEISADELLSIWYPFQRKYMVLYPADLENTVKDALAENFYEELNIQNAELKFRTDIENLPENPFALCNYGIILHRSGDDGGAWDAFSKAFEFDLPQRFISVQSDILETALTLGYADDIEKLIQPLLKRNTHDETLTVYQGWASLLKGEKAKAIDHFEKSRKINPNNETVVYAIKYKETMIQ